jgi:unconventional prefoldin RPB5 interactor 1
MSQAIKDSFLDLERHRQLLEDNVENLRKSLRHWQMWEAEYEGFKEEVLSAGPINDEQLRLIGESYEGELVTRKEIIGILGVGSKRTVAQVVNVLDRRMDYVQQNISTIQKQVDAAEHKLAAATVISNPDVRNEEGLPLTDITEELDDDGNIISSHTSTPGSSKPQLMEVLRKAGIQDIPEASIGQSAESLSSAVESRNSNSGEDKDAPTKSNKQKLEKKAVTFTEDTKPGPDVQKSQTEKRVEEIMSLVKRSQEKPSEPPIIPEHEAPEDAILRQSMLNYGLSEVGSVVAELELEEGSDWSGDEFDEDEFSASDDEDMYGRSTGRVVDDELRERMRELEARLGVRMMENISNTPTGYDITTEGIDCVSINGLEQGVSTGKETQVDKSDEKKSVRFSENIDVSTPPQNVSSSRSLKQAPVSDVLERTSSVQEVGAAQKSRTSRFKKSWTSPVANNATSMPQSEAAVRTSPNIDTRPAADTLQASADDASSKQRVYTVPTGPAGKTLASTIVEREVPVDMFPAEPDELDPNLMHQEVATEYHKARNRMIHRQGGFLQEEESEIVPFSEEEGGPKKMSRFKAARLASK